VLQDTVSTICHVQEVFGVTETSLLNFVVSDGSTLVATRFVNPPGSQAATLYYAEGECAEVHERLQYGLLLAM
jgi:glutamine amidotransferase